MASKGKAYVSNALSLSVRSWNYQSASFETAVPFFTRWPDITANASNSKTQLSLATFFAGRGRCYHVYSRWRMMVTLRQSSALPKRCCSSKLVMTALISAAFDQAEKQETGQCGSDLCWQRFYQSIKIGAFLQGNYQTSAPAIRSPMVFTLFSPRGVPCRPLNDKSPNCHTISVKSL